AARVDLLPKASLPTDWNGWFTGRFLVSTPGNYQLELKVPGTEDTVVRKFVVQESNPELDNTQPDFGQLYQIASPANDVLARMKEEDRNRLEPELRRTNQGQAQEVKAEDQGKLRLFFDLQSAALIPDCMITDSKTQKTRGRAQDVWDEGFLIHQDPPLKISWVLLGVVLLLSIEWLTRKLLKLA
ncbi:MAG: hypothetical protein JO112_17330, partial [Planctomycetes bacterium]|nr:hypothetical protein [Planctomycetota bacterium]